MQNQRLTHTYVLSQEGSNKLTNELDKRGIAELKRASFISNETNIYGCFVCDDTVRHILSKNKAVRENSIKSVFRALNLSGERGIDWIPKSNKQVHHQVEFQKTGRNYEKLNATEKQNLSRLFSHNHFIGREDDLCEIMKALHPERNRIIAIYGIGGVGKTALAMEVAYRCLEQREIKAGRLSPQNINYKMPCEIHGFYTFIFVSAKYQKFIEGQILPINDSQERTLRGIYRELLGFFDLPVVDSPEIQKDKIKEKLSENKTLLVIDNLETIEAEDLNKIIDFINELPSSTWTILTSRIHIGFKSIFLKELKKEDAIELINQQLQQKNLNDLTENEKNKLYTVTGGIPIALIYTIHRLSVGDILNNIISTLENRIDKEEIGNFLFKGEISKIHNKFVYKLLMSISLFDIDQPPTTEALVSVSGLVKSDGNSIDNIDEEIKILCNLSFIFKKDRKINDSSVSCYAVPPLAFNYIEGELKSNSLLYKELADRWISYYQTYLSEVVGTNRREDRHLNYGRITPEWKNILKVLMYCKDLANSNRDQNIYYNEIKKLWFKVNNYANLRGEWYQRSEWLRWLYKTAVKKKDDKTKIETMIYLGRTLLLQSRTENLQRAYNHLIKAWEDRDLVSFRMQDYIANHLAGVCIRMYKLDEDNKYLVEAHEWLNKQQSLLDNCKNLFNREKISYQIYIDRERAEVYLYQKNYEQVELLCEKVIDNAAEIENCRSQNYAYQLQAEVFIDQKYLFNEDRYLQAKKWLENGLEEVRENHDKRRIALYQSSLARLEMLRDSDSSTAKHLATNALTAFCDLGMKQEENIIRALLEKLPSNLSGLCFKVRARIDDKTITFICLDCKKAVNRDYPITEFYTEMLKLGYANSLSIPNNFTELKLHWELWRHQVCDSPLHKPRPPVIIYDSTEQTLSRILLEHLDDFGGSICIVDKDIRKNIYNLKQFPTNTYKLFDTIAKWIVEHQII